MELEGRDRTELPDTERATFELEGRDALELEGRERAELEGRGARCLGAVLEAVLERCWSASCCGGVLSWWGPYRDAPDVGRDDRRLDVGRLACAL